MGLQIIRSKHDHQRKDIVNHRGSPQRPDANGVPSRRSTVSRHDSVLVANSGLYLRAEAPLKPRGTIARRGHNLVHRLVRLEPGTTRNDEARVIPLVSDLLTILQDQKRLRDSRYPHCEWVFFREGEQILSFKAAWAAACVRADLVDAGGEPTKLFHDLRRTGVRNLVRAGVPEAVAMRISGHKTRAAFDHYNIDSESDLTDAAEKLDQHIRRRRTQDEKSEGGDDES
ncbi:MAG: tyrosine-type recombinase/integrase [Acidobacteriota bacterium]